MMHLLTALGSDLMRGAPISEVESVTFFIMMWMVLMIAVVLVEVMLG